MRTLTGHTWLDMTAVVSSPGGQGTATDGSQYPSSTGTSTVMCTVQPDTSREAMERMRLTGRVQATGYFDPKTTTGGATVIAKDSTLSITDSDGVTIHRYKATAPHWRAGGVVPDVVFVAPLEELS